MNTHRMLLAALALLPFGAGVAQAANIAKTYSYFTVRGSTLEELEDQLNNHGPEVKSTGKRHPGATQMQFTTKLGFAENKRSCRVATASATVSAKVILPRWGQRGRADRSTRLIWDTLSSDIKRHEEQHVVIAKNYARTLEGALVRLGKQNSCGAASAKAQATANKILAQHDKAQEEFDRIEGINFERRMGRQLQYRMERITAGKLPG